jgi:predicted small metal-binding protein
MEAAMTRKFIDCRDYPSDSHCSLALSADSEDELLEAAVQHGCAVHGYKDTPELRNELRRGFKEGTPPVESKVAEPA